MKYDLTRQQTVDKIQSFHVKEYKFVFCSNRLVEPPDNRSAYILYLIYMQANMYKLLLGYKGSNLGCLIALSWNHKKSEINHGFE